jgi:hypothetical protein
LSPQLLQRGGTETKRFVPMTRIGLSARLSTILGTGLVLGFVALATPAAAQGDNEMACQNDAFRFCEKFIPDRGKVGACLRRNLVRLAPDCRRNFTGRRKSLRRR